MVARVRQLWRVAVKIDHANTKEIFVAAPKKWTVKEVRKFVLKKVKLPIAERTTPVATSEVYVAKK